MEEDRFRYLVFSRSDSTLWGVRQTAMLFDNCHHSYAIPEGEWERVYLVALTVEEAKRIDAGQARVQDGNEFLRLIHR